MRAVYLFCPILDPLRPELSWTHYRPLLRVEKPEAGTFSEAEAINSCCSTRELGRQIHSILFEQSALSRDREGMAGGCSQAERRNGPQAAKCCKGTSIP